MMATDAMRKAVRKYDAANTSQFHLKLNNKTDEELIEHLKRQANIQGYLKELIRDDMKKTEARAFWETHTSFDFPWDANNPVVDKTKLRCSMCGRVYENTGEMYEKCPSCGRTVSCQQTH